MLGAVTEGAARGTGCATDITVTVPCSTTSIGTGSLSIPDVSTTGRHTTLNSRAATTIASCNTSIAVAIGTSGRATAGVVVLVTGAGHNTDLLGITATGSGVGLTLVAVTVVTTLWTTAIGVLPSAAGCCTNACGCTATGAGVGSTLVTEGLLRGAIVVAAVGTRGCTPASVHTDVDAVAAANL